VDLRCAIYPTEETDAVKDLERMEFARDAMPVRMDVPTTVTE
jgi:hypothetical protein